MESVHRPEDNELVGFVCAEKDKLWSPLTVFQYALAEPMPKEAAIGYLCSHGLAVLADTWQFYDASDTEWYACTAIEAKPGHVTIRISDYGHPNVNEVMAIQHPYERKIRYI